METIQIREKCQGALSLPDMHVERMERRAEESSAVEISPSITPEDAGHHRPQLAWDLWPLAH